MYGMNQLEVLVYVSADFLFMRAKTLSEADNRFANLINQVLECHRRDGLGQSLLTT